ncbi:MAG: MlaD family protein [Desulfobacterales bacterium]|jgi:paraquat-inducible protein B
MAKQINKTVIGGFVVSVIVMLIGSVIILGGGELFKKKLKYVMFFEQSITGLRVGAPVVFKGVEIGSVGKIFVNYDMDKLTVDIPVIVEFDPSLVRMKGPQSRYEREYRQELNGLIERGLRAQLKLQSMVTGQLMIELDFFPDTPVRLTGIESEYAEVPTMPSSMEKLAQKLKEMPIDEIVDKLVGVLDNIEKVTGDSKIENIVSNVDAAGKNLNSLISGTDEIVADVGIRTKKVLDNLVVTSSEAQKFMVDARKLVKDVDGQIQPLSDKAQDTLVSAKKTMDQANTTLTGVNNFVGDNSNTRHKLNRALDEFATAAQSMNSLMDYLERHPEALLKGKSNKGG